MTYTNISQNLARFSEAIKTHNQVNPTHTVLGIGLNIIDINRLDLEIGEEILPGVPIQEDSGIVGAFRIICDGLHNNGIQDEVEPEITEAIGVEA